MLPAAVSRNWPIRLKPTKFSEAPSAISTPAVAWPEMMFAMPGTDPPTELPWAPYWIRTPEPRPLR